MLLSNEPEAHSEKNAFKVIGYYAGNTVPLDSIDWSELTHVIYCFGNLCDDRFCLRSTQDSLAVRQMVGLKKEFPDLKVMLSLGGWGGCASCSDIFSTVEGRRNFSQSILEVASYFKIDGLDLDWEYPVVKGFPGHKRAPDDKANFTALLEELRRSNGPEFILSFAAGGYTDFIDSAIEWKRVVPLVDFVNVMTYDLVHGYSTVSGHHTPLYSTNQQQESTDHAVMKLLSEGVPGRKIIIGAAFYGRVFRIMDGYPVGLYQPCKFDHTFQYKRFAEELSGSGGYTIRFDSTANAPFAVNEQDRFLASFDDPVSIAAKTRYAVEHGLGGVMFWQLCDDRNKDGLLDVIHRNVPSR